MLALSILAIVLSVDPTWAAQPDAWITTKAKIALLTTPGAPATDVNVDTVDGVVSLHGTVGTPAEKRAAEAAVKGIDGVKQVRSLLQVVASSRQPRVAATDADLQTRVATALAADASLPPSGVTVQSVNQGVVLLGGQVDTLTQHLHALAVASRVEGVKSVASEIKSPQRLADAEIYLDPKAQPAAGPRAGTAQVTMDALTTSAVKLALMADPRTPGLDVNVDTTGGRVTLFGMVDSAAAKAAAEEDVRSVAGVKTVDNALQVVAPKRQERVQTTDQEVDRHVTAKLSATEGLSASNITVEVQSGIVRLSGTVPNQEQRLLAALSARTTEGVRAVKDDLTITP